MPYVLSPLIVLESPGMWFEGPAYEKKNIYKIEDGKMPPVNYDEHIFRSHSLTHLETPAHTNKNGRTIEYYYQNNIRCFYGKTLVLKLPGNYYKKINENIFHWVISKDQIVNEIKKMKIQNLPSKILISTDFYPLNKQNYHDTNYVLTLSQEAANYLVEQNDFDLYGTSWKSSDYNPGKIDRPIHNTLFQKAVILENLNLKDVPTGLYFMCAFPIPIDGASEAPVVPILFTRDEIIL